LVDLQCIGRPVCVEADWSQISAY